MSVDGNEVVLDPGGPTHSQEDIPTKPPPKKRSANVALKATAPRSSGGVVTATLVSSEGNEKTTHSELGQSVLRIQVYNALYTGLKLCFIFAKLCINIMTKIPSLSLSHCTITGHSLPSKKMKLSQKVSEQQQQHLQTPSSLPSSLTALPTSSLHNSDWGGSSDEEQVHISTVCCSVLLYYHIA